MSRTVAGFESLRQIALFMSIAQALRELERLHPGVGPFLVAPERELGQNRVPAQRRQAGDRAGHGQPQHGRPGCTTDAETKSAWTKSSGSFSSQLRAAILEDSRVKAEAWVKHPRAVPQSQPIGS